jgi:hypothetical protein
MRADEVDDDKRALGWAKELFALQKALLQKEVETNLVVEHHYHAPEAKKDDTGTETKDS